MQKANFPPKLLKTALEESGIEEGERAVLQTTQTLMTQEKAAKDAVKTQIEALNLAVFKQFGRLSEAEIKQLAVQDKWLADLQSRIENRLGKQYSAAYQPLEHAGRPLPQPDGRACPRSGKVAKAKSMPTLKIWVLEAEMAAQTGYKASGF
ncbi:hypothetical protein [Salmonella enterica]|uniref:hypothetical protein n=1 Tax=Salmonella enterica TaxID=28901 RepID=UPI001CA51365|nr:hypothetical protein [Salmonella enterica]